MIRHHNQTTDNSSQFFQLICFFSFSIEQMGFENGVHRVTKSSAKAIISAFLLVFSVGCSGSGTSRTETEEAGLGLETKEPATPSATFIENKVKKTKKAEEAEEAEDREDPQHERITAWILRTGAREVVGPADQHVESEQPDVLDLGP